MKSKKIFSLIPIVCAFLLLSAMGAFGQCPVGQIETVPGSGLCIIDPTVIPKYTDPLIIPPVMPQAIPPANCPAGVDYYEIAVRQFNQVILPQSLGLQTPIWSYGSVTDPATFNYPAFTVENAINKPTRVKWINDLVDANGNYLPHLLGNVVDQTLHWANPPGGMMGRDMKGTDPNPYLGPVPIITHVHGAHVGPESDGYPEAWWLPNANNIPAGYATHGTLFDQFDKTNTQPGTAVFQYPNTQRASTLWYHDHTLGMTRLNVQAGPAGFWLIRGAGGTEPDVLAGGVLPGPAPAPGQPLWLPVARGNGAPPYREIPIAIQDRSFYPDGRLFYPDNRAFFEGVPPNQLLINFVPNSDISPIWNPEVFLNTIVVNGRTWPFQNVEPVRYRLRLLNGCSSRFLNLAMFVVNANGTLGAEVPFYQIGTEGGLLPNVVKVETGFTTVLPNGARTAASDPAKALLLALAERADVIVDFTGLAPGTVVRMINTGPDFPFGGFPIPPLDLSNPATTGQVMEFVVVPEVTPNSDTSTPPAQLSLAPRVNLTPGTVRQVSLNELDSAQVCVQADPFGAFLIPITQIPTVLPGPNFLADCAAAGGVPFGPQAAMLGTMVMDPAMNMPMPMPMMWMDAITENPKLNSVETWEIFNFTMDAHPIHIHMVQFEVVDRQAFDMMTNLPIGVPRAPEAWESGHKDTVVAYPGEITRVRAYYDIPGLFVWHCHITEHEDNEMMRPYQVGDTVTIQSSTYDPATLSLTVVATSSDQPNATLTAQGFGPLAWKPWKNFYRATFTGVPSNPASVTVTSSGGGSATYTAPAADMVMIGKVLYDAVGQKLTVIATSNMQPGAHLTAVGYGPLVWKAWLGFYRATFSGVLAPPASVTVTSSLGGTATYTATADTVAISSVSYNGLTQSLTVIATSSQQPNAQLTAVGYGPLAWKSWLNFYRATFTGVLAPPASVTVTSSLGGTATLP